MLTLLNVMHSIHVIQDNYHDHNEYLAVITVLSAF